jgi:hypothetical protein
MECGFVKGVKMRTNDILKRINLKCKEALHEIDIDTSYNRVCKTPGCSNLALEGSKFCNKHHSRKYKKSKIKNCWFPDCNVHILKGFFCREHTASYRRARLGVPKQVEYNESIFKRKNWIYYINKMTEEDRWSEDEILDLQKKGFIKLKKGVENG